MSDYYRGGGRPRDSGYNRKRRYRDEDDQEPRYSRPRYEETLFSRIRKETLTLAETPLVKTEDAIQTVAKNVTDNFDDEEVRRGFLDLVTMLVIEQPFKIPFVACVVMLINTTTPEMATMILEEMAKLATEDLEKGELAAFKLRLRFFGCLQGILEGDGIFPTLNDVVEKARILQENGELEISLELVKIALINLPYIMASPAADQKEKALEIIEKATPIAHKNHPLKALQKPFTNIEEYEIGTPIVQLLHQQLIAENESGWELKFLPRPWLEFKERIDSSTKQKMPRIDLPDEYSHIPADSIIPEHFFSVYFSQTVETIPPPNNIACCILRDAVTDTADTLNFNRLAVARFFIDIDCYFATDAFIKRATPYDRVQEKAKEGSTWKSEDVAVDAIFAQLFRLPKPKHKMVYYHSVLTEICKLAPAAIAPSLGRAIRCLYNNLESLDVELINRFVDWFSHHLSNFGFTWKWAEWVQHLALPDIHPKKAFIIETLEKEIRLSFTGRIKSTLPDEYTNLLSEGKELDTPIFKFDLPDQPFAEEGRNILQMLKERKPEEEIDAALTSILTAASSQPETIPDPAAFIRDIYVQSICHIGSKSLSHVLSCIERCKAKLLAIGAESPIARRQIIASVMSYWRDHPGVGANVVDKLLNYSILTPASVIEWVLFDADNGRSLSKSHAWEMVNTTIMKVNNRVKSLNAAKPRDENLDEIAPDVLQAFNQTLENAKIEQKLLADLLLDGLKEMSTNPPDVDLPADEPEPVKTEGEVDVNMDGEPKEGDVIGTNDAGDIIVPRKLTREERIQEQKEWIRWWARNWGKTFTRKFMVEEGVVDKGREGDFC